MGPTELSISGLIALAALFPISAALQETTPPGKPVRAEVEPPKVEIMHDYVVKPDCKGPDGIVGPCVICSKTGKMLGINN